MIIMGFFESINHYYNLVTFTYEANLTEQLEKQELARQQLKFTLPDQLMQNCANLIKEMEKDNLLKTLEEVTSQCKNYYKIIQLPQIKASLENEPPPKIIHTRFTKAIHDQKSCYTLCSELNTNLFNYSNLAIDSDKTKEAVKEAIQARGIFLGAIAVGVAFSAFKGFQQNRTQRAKILACIAAITACTAIFFVSSIPD